MTAYFTERNGMRKPLEYTSVISLDMYAMIFERCQKYYNNIAWRWPRECDDGYGCYELNIDTFSRDMKFEIPDLYCNSYQRVCAPKKDLYSFDTEEIKYNQYALLDFIELIAQNCKDCKERTARDFHPHFSHYHLNFLETNRIFYTFRDDINDVFKKTGLLYTLTDEKIIERVIEYSPLTEEIENAVQSFSEYGVRDLMKDAIAKFRDPRPSERKYAVEKIWDALERLKTYYEPKNKSASAQKIISLASGDKPEFVDLFNAEFKLLTEIGNKFKIRHHEIGKIEITDDNHYDYFFNRCLSLIALVLRYLP